MEIRALSPDDAPACDAIITSLPYHFALENGRQMCAAAVRSQAGLVATVDRETVGFLTFEDRFDAATEISWMAVHAEHRRGGIGHALVERLAADQMERGRRLLLVTTVSPNDPDESPEPPDGYQATRAFYASVGFGSTRDLPGLWGPDADLAHLMVRVL